MRTLRSLKLLSLTLAAAASIIFATSCGTSSAQVRIVIAIPDAPTNYDLAINGTTLFTDVGFESVSPATGYQTVSSGSDSFNVYQTGTVTPVNISTSIHLGGSRQYTVVATGLAAATSGVDAPAIALLIDNNTAPKTGDVEFRMVHASPSAPGSVDVYIVPTGTSILGLSPNISGLAFQQASDYQSFSAATYAYVLFTVIVTPAGSKTPFLSQNYTLSAGQIRTLVLVDVPGGGTPSPTPLELFDLN